MTNEIEHALRARNLSQRFSAFDLCCAGETWVRTRIDNRPKQCESWQSLQQLCETILEPVTDRFGCPRISYGFASPELIRQIPERIAPTRDQHAGHELNRHNKPVCERLGQAVDFEIIGQNMAQVAQWVATHLPYDRLYFYGTNKPLHVSVGPERSGQLIAMLPSVNGRRTPRKIKLDWFERQTEQPSD